MLENFFWISLSGILSSVYCWILQECATGGVAFSVAYLFFTIKESLTVPWIEFTLRVFLWSFHAQSAYIQKTQGILQSWCLFYNSFLFLLHTDTSIHCLDDCGSQESCKTFVFQNTGYLKKNSSGYFITKEVQHPFPEIFKVSSFEWIFLHHTAVKFSFFTL